MGIQCDLNSVLDLRLHEQGWKTQKAQIKEGLSVPQRPTFSGQGGSLRESRDCFNVHADVIPWRRPRGAPNDCDDGLLSFLLRQRRSYARHARNAKR
jgi:hypothetical protein